MDWVCEELDEVRVELEEFKEECRAKKELCDSLRKAHNEQVIKFQEAKVQIEKQAQELNVKSEEISQLKQLYEDLKSSFNEKDSLLEHLNFASEKLLADYGGRFQKLEGENKELAMALDEATTRIQTLESKICSGNEEVEGLKRLLSNKQQKCFKADQKAIVSKELKQRLDTILKQEEENRHIQEQLKWKNEQFVHLEEAHRRLQDQFRSCKADWERERSTLVEEISSLQTNLDSQTRTSETLQTQLKMCNQALAHEESRRKFLEVEVSELQLYFEFFFENSHETNSKIEHLTLTRDEEIGNLRNLLGTKETLSKEMEHKIAHLKQEKQGLNVSLKESQITNAGMTSSLKKLKKKIQDLQQLHKNCLLDLQKKKFE